MKQKIHGNENIIKMIEYIRGLYRYPYKMLGRKLPLNDHNNHTDVLVFAAHPDDDVLGLGTTLYRHSLNGENIKVIFVTNGTGRDGESWKLKVNESTKKSEIRYFEAAQALSLINIPKENIICLGYPDGGTQRYLKNISVDIHALIQRLNPGRIYVHCIEGGHGDHDMTSLVVKSVCNKIGFFNVFEWAEYNLEQPLGTLDIKFLPSLSTKFKEIKIDISEEERIIKRKMLASHHSQDVEQFFLQGEAIRQADMSELETEINEHYQLPKSRTLPIVKEFYKSTNI
ncbi:PIG-L deacetylase family protein [Lederbergia citrea]|uniref:PIG-L family deacetylase n=1 Tax=Lederbergia citrea TaxID=2833581 RepID=A0A942UQ21_9BACI|nr:PIG-L family deacetylase [Lederbergia citrea]MBS4205801.1 PIG-L family deacetylase [Lederbergia citrea]MBS4224750.1 PIG-L family deacetylase [Lederbergia citrea]